MKIKLTILLLLTSLVAICQDYSGNSFRARSYVNSPVYKLNGTKIDSVNSVNKYRFFTDYQYYQLNELYTNPLWSNIANIYKPTQSDYVNIGDVSFNGFGLGVKFYQEAGVGANLFTIRENEGFDILKINQSARLVLFDSTNQGYKVGIGTAPTYKLDVKGTQRLTMPDNTAYSFKLTGTSEDDYLSINTGTTGKNILIDETGMGVKVGIGTTNPLSELHIKGTYPSLIIEELTGKYWQFLVNATNGNLLFQGGTGQNVGIDRATPTYKLDVGGTSRFGTTSNYTSTEADGTLVFTGDATVYRDVVVPFSIKGTGDEASFDLFVGGIRAYKFAINKQIYTENAEAPHDWQEGSGIEIHLHYSSDALETNAAKVQFELEYTFANMVINGNTNTVFTSDTTNVEFTIPAGTAARSNLYATLLSLNDAAMASYKMGCAFMIRIKRIAKTAGGNDPTGNIFGLNIGIHYKADTFGSRNQTTK